MQTFKIPACAETTTILLEIITLNIVEEQPKDLAKSRATHSRRITTASLQIKKKTKLKSL